ncbi:MAG: bifunctional glutamate N-acetyltransferase/amino-acid acetyltransferase ArgJ [Oscillospiraceae bacterium]|jgi:glutamate N-acetyltransferase/amino-acid N-acetyltransferase|nr:bifunctional glutamate N-acetyltransferase/amino-acid acetyltransferase ArgJ [Oscillospiraceae bacterium]
MSIITTIRGGVCAPKGFSASGIHCGIRKNKTKKDLALIVSESRAAAAAVYTQNLVKGAPILVTKSHIADGYAQAIVCNSGNANTCNANGVEVAQEMCALAAAATGVAAEDVLVASTGVIGQPLDITPIAAAMPALAAALGDNSADAADAIMTTDLVAKEIAVCFTINGTECKMGGIAKGSGMIHPNMATMLVFITTDAAIPPALLQKALSEDVRDTFNMISIDGDTSTNDTVALLANGKAENPPVEEGTEAYVTFQEALKTVTTYLCREIAKDGEGATKLLTCKVTGAADAKTAKSAAKSVICSSLVKTAMFGADANWGRVLCALGYSGADLDVSKIDVAFASAAGTLTVCKNGAGTPFSEELAREVLTQGEVEILVELHSGDTTATAWGCDLTYDYVKINGDYRT